METSSIPETRAGSVRAAWDRFLDYQRFVRLSVFGLTAMMPLLGAASASAHLPTWKVWGLVAVALAFHHYIYVLNDVVDLPVDRRHPRRVNYPLVKGTLTPRQALFFALAQLPLAFLLTGWMEGSWVAHLALAIAVLMGAIYDLWGKVNPFPPLTDTLQGVAWAGLIFYGVALAGAWPTLLTWILAAFVLVFIILVNGIHGSLRDLVSDRAAGMTTTAILLGASADEERGISLPPRLLVYTFALQALCTGLVLWPLATNAFGYDGATLRYTWAAVGALQALSIAADVLMVRTRTPPRMFGPVMLHIVFSLLSVIALFAPFVDRPVLLAVLISFFGPLFIYDTYYKPVLRLFRRPARGTP